MWCTCENQFSGPSIWNLRIKWVPRLAVCPILRVLKWFLTKASSTFQWRNSLFNKWCKRMKMNLPPSYSIYKNRRKFFIMLDLITFPDITQIHTHTNNWSVGGEKAQQLRVCMCVCTVLYTSPSNSPPQSTFPSFLPSPPHTHTLRDKDNFYKTGKKDH